MAVCDLKPGAELDQVLLVKRLERMQARNGRPYLRLLLGDRTGAVRAMVWEEVEAATEILGEGRPVHVRGRFSVHPEYGPEIKLSALAPAVEGSYEEADLRGAGARGVDELERELRALVESCGDPHLRALLELAFDPAGKLWERFREAPAAKRFHEAYRHGLLEHTLTVARAVAAVAPTLSGCDRDLALAGALLHDIGKLDAYSLKDGTIEMTDEGRLLGEIALGYRRVGGLLGRVEGFPSDRALALLHIILSHHGSLEHGSPVLPATREATLVHMIDNLSGKLGSFERLARELAPGHAWSQFDRALGTSAYFGAPS
jgi:3'-5' exoribonuclease